MWDRSLQERNMKPISFISPSRNNISYLKWMYNSIRKNLGYVHEILLADDSSTDGTVMGSGPVVTKKRVTPRVKKATAKLPPNPFVQEILDLAKSVNKSNAWSHLSPLNPNLLYRISL